ncbi:HD-like signal output (HDOD) protein [Geothermobacter ehrlichii]|uniref:HD-like signal output (HDOD) protein n=1 Tax=Geothermobacter ehrlichii TaxID=213224 RepID=A0A5D3WM47_9BACT|nr:HDOD domain-containing protein [Geothermobacter ehrlichii]TYO99920.1 HD-like signal output (HDOD) protein [Geothermobacter ehrlichii]
MSDQSLLAMVQQALEAKDLKLPVFNRTALELQRALQKDDFDLAKCAALISRDQALVSEVLKEANSSFYSGLKKVVTIQDAMVRLGAKEVLRLTVQITQRGLYRSKIKGLQILMERLWKHALGTALGAFWLARHAGYQNLMQEAFLGGLMHDIGQLFLLKVLEDVRRANPQVSLSEALVMEVLVTLHVEQGYRLMQHWGLPEEYADIVRYHHHDEPPIDSPLLSLVMLANQACRKLGISLRHEPELILATTREAQLLGIKETTLAQLEIALEDKFFPKQPSAVD